MTGAVFKCEMTEDGDMYSFLLKRNNDFLTIGLQEVLMCLRIAELSGKINPLSDFWQYIQHWENYLLIPKPRSC